MKFWVYRERRQDIFRVILQMMLTVMIITIVTLAVNYLNIFVTSLTGGGVLVYYLCAALLEILYFIIFQFIIFKKN